MNYNQFSLKGRWLIACLLVAGFLPAQSQALNKSFHVRGYIKGLQTTNGYVYLMDYLRGKSAIDSVKAIDGHFEFEGRVEPCMARIYTQRIGELKRVNMIEFFLDGAQITIAATYDSSSGNAFKNPVIKGSASNDEYDAYMDQLNTITHDMKLKEWNSAFVAASKKNDTARMKALTSVSNEKVARATKYMDQYIQDHPHSFVSLYLVGKMSVATGDILVRAKRLFNMLAPELQSSAAGEAAAKTMATVSRGEIVGQPVGDFAQPDTSGKLVRLSDFKGKYVLIDFWASWCGSCRIGNRKLKPIYDRFKDKGFQVLAFSFDTDKAAWEKAIVADSASWSNVSDLKGFDGEMATRFGVVLIPSTFLIDPNGIVLERTTRPEDLEKKLEALLRK
ncbi:MAG: AhpC/TSA family protein [Bacteroidetes bacterium]|nr:AhpC/TSA family protein [Bacteroidota bacterium]